MESVKNAWRNVFRQPSRSVLTVLSIAIGVFSVLLIGTISDLGRDAVIREFASLGMNGITVSAGDGTAFTDETLQLAKASAGVAQATPLSCSYSDVLVRGTETKGLVWGVDTDVSEVISLNVIYGRSISREDVRAESRVCLVEQNFARELYHRDNAVGKTLSIRLNGREETFTIVGVVEAGGGILQSLMGETVPLFVYLPYTTLGECSGAQGFSRMAVRLAEDADPDRVGDSLTRTLNTYSQQGGEVSVENLSRYAEQFAGILDLVSAVLSAIAGISLLVAGLSIMTVMLSSVGERTREIGVKKSIGASKGVIVREFLLEAGFLALLGSLAGTGAGVLAGWLGCLALGIDYWIRPALMIGCIACAILTAIVFGAYPAGKAASLRPVEALRHD